MLLLELDLEELPIVKHYEVLVAILFEALFVDCAPHGALNRGARERLRPVKVRRKRKLNEAPLRRNNVPGVLVNRLGGPLNLAQDPIRLPL